MGLIQLADTMADGTSGNGDDVHLIFVARNDGG